MENTTWQKQTAEPLFPDLLWSRPEHQRHRGKLLIVGGNLHSFTAPANAYSAAMKASVGTVRVMLPESLKKTLSKFFAEAEFAPANPSGSFSRQSLAQMLESASWADGVLLAGDFGRNSETAVLLESFADKYSGQLSVTQDGADYFLGPSTPLLSRQGSLMSLDLSQLQKLAKNNRPSTPVLHNMSLYELVKVLEDWTSSTPASFITKHPDNIVVAAGGRVSTTASPEKDLGVMLPAYGAVWWLQQPDKPFEAVTTAVYEYIKTPRKN